MERRIFLHSIAYALGEPEPISTIEPIAHRQIVLEYLLGMGLRDYRRTERSPPQLAVAALRRTIELAGLAPSQLDAVVYVSTAFWKREWYSQDISALLAELGAHQATPIGVTLSECGNLATALRVASGLVASGQFNNLLLVTTDTCPSPELRLVEPSVSVLSDGAASCVVSAEEPRGFELLGVQQTSNHKIRLVNPETEAVKILRYIAEGVRRSARGLMGRLSLDPSQVSRLILGNLNRNVQQIFAAQCEVPFERVYTENVATLGHVFASDGLINLKDATATGVSPGERLLVITNGMANWGAVALEAVGSGD